MFENTVKLRYNDHSYNEFTAITKNFTDILGPIWLFLQHKLSLL